MKVWAYIVIVVTLALVLVYPLTWPDGRDSFPLSSYPMFAHGRKSARLDAVYAVAVDAGGGRRFVPPELVANREVLQARAVLNEAARKGREAAEDLCGAIAERVAARPDLGFADAVEIRVVRGKHDALAYFDHHTLGEERVLASCQVAR